jgi:hypothetical protein
MHLTIILSSIVVTSFVYMTAFEEIYYSLIFAFSVIFTANICYNLQNKK